MNDFFDLEKFQKELQHFVDSIALEALKIVVSYALLPGGKFIRPRFAAALLEDLKITNKNNSNYWRLFSALEILHVATLIHDDLPAIDNDDLRRGKPSCHKKFGEGKAILAADYLFTAAPAVVLECELSETAQCRAMAAILEAGSKINLGQILDLENKIYTIEDYCELVKHKTAALFEAAAELALCAENLSVEQRKAVLNYAQIYGIIFQIKNDQYEAEGQNLEVGRLESSDSRNEKTNIFSAKFKDHTDLIISKFKDSENELFSNLKAHFPEYEFEALQNLRINNTL